MTSAPEVMEVQLGICIRSDIFLLGKHHVLDTSECRRVFMSDSRSHILALHVS